MEPFCSLEEGSRHALTPWQGPPPPEEDSGQAVVARANGTTWRHGAEHIPPPHAHGHCRDHGALDPGDTRSGTSRTRTCLSQYAFISLLNGVCLLILNWTTEPSCPATFRLMWSFSVFTPSYKRRKMGSQHYVSNNHKTLADCWAFRQVIQSNPILKILQQSTHSCDCLITTKNLFLTSIDIYQAST